MPAIRFPSRIEGHRIHIEAPKNCDSLSCIRISAPGLTGSAFNLKGFKGFNSDDDDAAEQFDRAKDRPGPRRSGDRAGGTRTGAGCEQHPGRRSDNGLDHRCADRHRCRLACCTDHADRASGRPRRTKAMSASSTAGEKLCGYAEKTGEQILIDMKPSGFEMGRPDSRSRQRQGLRLHDRDEGTERAARSRAARSAACSAAARPGSGSANAAIADQRKSSWIPRGITHPDRAPRLPIQDAALDPLTPALDSVCIHLAFSRQGHQSHTCHRHLARDLPRASPPVFICSRVSWLPPVRDARPGSPRCRRSRPRQRHR